MSTHGGRKPETDAAGGPSPSHMPMSAHGGRKPAADTAGEPATRRRRSEDRQPVLGRRYTEGGEDRLL